MMHVDPTPCYGTEMSEHVNAPVRALPDLARLLEFDTKLAVLKQAYFLLPPFHHRLLSRDGAVGVAPLQPVTVGHLELTSGSR